MANTNRVDSSIREIEKAYKLGKALLKESPEGIIHGATENLARKYRIKAEKVRKLRALADAKRGFTRDQLDAQFRIFEKNGRSLTLSHLIRSLAIKNRNRRKGALGIALERKLSSHLFQGLITSMQTKAHRAGRRPKPIVTRNFDVYISSLVWTWARQLNEHLGANKIADRKLDKAVRTLQGQMETVIGLGQGKKKP